MKRILKKFFINSIWGGIFIVLGCTASILGIGLYLGIVLPIFEIYEAVKNDTLTLGLIVQHAFFFLFKELLAALGVYLSILLGGMISIALKK